MEHSTNRWSIVNKPVSGLIQCKGLTATPSHKKTNHWDRQYIRGANVLLSDWIHFHPHNQSIITPTSPTSWRPQKRKSLSKETDLGKVWEVSLKCNKDHRYEQLNKKMYTFYKTSNIYCMNNCKTTANGHLVSFCLWYSIILASKPSCQLGRRKCD